MIFNETIDIISSIKKSNNNKLSKNKNKPNSIFSTKFLNNKLFLICKSKAQNIESAKVSDMLSIINDSSKSFLKSQNVWFYELNINKMRNMNVLEDVILKNISNKEKIIYFSHNISHEIFNIFKSLNDVIDKNKISSTERFFFDNIISIYNTHTIRLIDPTTLFEMALILDKYKNYKSTYIIDDAICNIEDFFESELFINY